MFADKSTLIVGAGASLDFGMPSGHGLWTAVKQFIGDTFAITKPRPPSGLVHVSAVPRLTLDSPAALAMFHLLKLEPHQARARLGYLVEQLADADVHASVDDFIRDNPSAAGEIKVAIAASLFNKLYEKDGNFWLRSDRLLARQIQQEEGSPIPNWCRQFVGVCRPLLRDKASVVRMTIVNFNYDRVMETVLRHFWTRSEEAYHAFDECFEFVYPYGAFEDLPEEMQFPHDWICKQASAIGLASGTENARASELKAHLDASQIIFSVGFSFARANTELLGFNAHHGLKTFFQNYANKDTRLNRVLATFGVDATRRDTGSMTDLITNGFFEQRV